MRTLGVRLRIRELDDDLAQRVKARDGEIEVPDARDERASVTPLQLVCELLAPTLASTSGTPATGWPAIDDTRDLAVANQLQHERVGALVRRGSRAPSSPLRARTCIQRPR